jgi:hypothetical protein
MAPVRSPLVRSSFAALRKASYCSIHWLAASSLALTVRMCTRTIAAIAAITTPSARKTRPFLLVRDVSSSSSISASCKHAAERHIAEYSVLMAWRKASTQPEESLPDNRAPGAVVREAAGGRAIPGAGRGSPLALGSATETKIGESFNVFRVNAAGGSLTARSGRQVSLPRTAPH